MFQKITIAFTLFVFTLFVFFSCASQKNKTSTVKTEEKQKLVISFISNGSGTNSALFTKTKELLDKAMASNDCKLSYQVKPWGREGEKDICLDINANKCYTDLLEQLKKLIANDDRIQFKENGVCRP